MLAGQGTPDEDLKFCTLGMQWSHACSAYCSRQIRDRTWSRCKDTQGWTLACIFHIPDEMLGQKYFTYSITELVSSEITYWHGQSVLMSLTMVLSLARISACLKDSLAFFSLSLKTTTIYSIWAGFRKTRTRGRNKAPRLPKETHRLSCLSSDPRCGGIE